MNFLEFSSDAAKVFLRTTRSYEEKVRTGEVTRTVFLTASTSTTGTSSVT